MASILNTVNIHVYGRYSDAKQDKSLTVQTQLFQDACTDLIPSLFGGRTGNIVGSYADEGKSASRKKIRRRDFERLLQDIEGGQVKVLLVLNLSRFARLHHIDAMKLHIKLYDHNVILVSIDDRKIIGIKDLMSFLEVAFKSNNDHEYARTVGKNTLRGSIKNVREGQAHCKDTAYGLAKLYITDTGGEIIIKRKERLSKSKDWKVYLIQGDNHEADVIKWIFETYAKSDISPAYIARQLNQHIDQIVRLGSNGKGWREETIKNILRNHHYNGKVFIGMAPKGEHYRTNNLDVGEADTVQSPKPLIVPSKVADKYPALIDDKLWSKVQKKIQHNKQVNRRAVKSENTEGHCLTGVLKCGHCGRSLCSFNLKNIRYQCKNRATCKYWSVSESEMIPFVLKRIDKELLKKLNSKPSKETDNHFARLQEIDARIEALQTSLKTASVQAIPSITGAIESLLAERNKVSESSIDQHSRFEAAYERWEALMEPLCYGIKTGNVGEDNPDVKHLGLQDEVDRLFNTTYAMPSAIRNTLHELDCRVDCWFVETNNGKFTLDRGRITCTIDGCIRTNNLSQVC